MVEGAQPAAKPTWRGRLHQWAAVYVLGAGTMLLLLATTLRARVAVGVYAVSLATLFGVSAVYHRITWRPRVRTWLRRADHASIFLLIAGTYTPVALLGIGGEAGARLAGLVWLGAALGMIVSLFWPRAPKLVSALIALAVGWTVVPYWNDLRRALAVPQLTLIVTGGIVYTIGAVVYAARRPNPWPRAFGYHEVFHMLTLIAAVMHLVVVASIIRAA